MGSRSRLSVSVFCFYGCWAIPSSMIEEINARELRPSKVKRVSMAAEDPEEGLKIDNHYYGNPTAIKRGTEMKNEGADDELSNDSDWMANEQGIYQNVDNDFQSPVYNDESSQSAKSMDDYDKGFQYGGDREKFDEAIENAVLKSEYYGNLDPDKKKRKKRNSRQYSFENRVTSDDSSPEEVLDLLSLYETERQKPEATSRDSEQDSALWSDVPVRPGALVPSSSNLVPSYLMDQSPANLEKSRWQDYRNKHFTVAKKRNDPTREIRYINGPSKHDYYYLSQSSNNRRDTNVPVYHRYVL